MHIVRDPYAVFASTVHLWRKTQSFGHTHAHGYFCCSESHVIQTLKEMYDGFDAARLALPPDRFHQMRYEDLVREPMIALSKLSGNRPGRFRRSSLACRRLPRERS